MWGFSLELNGFPGNHAEVQISPLLGNRNQTVEHVENQWKPNQTGNAQWCFVDIVSLFRLETVQEMLKNRSCFESGASENSKGFKGTHNLLGEPGAMWSLESLKSKVGRPYRGSFACTWQLARPEQNCLLKVHCCICSQVLILLPSTDWTGL
jgi:hypothetical protein